MESRVTILMRMVISKVLPDHMTLESKLERDEGERYATMLGKNIMKYWKKLVLKQFC